MAYAFTCHDSFILVIWVIQVCVTWLSSRHMCHGSFIYVPWLIHMCDISHSCKARARSLSHSILFPLDLRSSWLVISFTCDMTHLCEWYSSFNYVPWLIYTLTWVIHLIHAYDMRHVSEALSVSLCLSFSHFLAFCLICVGSAMFLAVHHFVLLHVTHA